MPDRDKCMLDDFIVKKPLKDFFLSQSFVKHYATFSSKEGTRSIEDLTDMSIVLYFFTEEVRASVAEKKLSFCESFYKDQNREKSNRDYCMFILRLTSDSAIKAD